MFNGIWVRNNLDYGVHYCIVPRCSCRGVTTVAQPIWWHTLTWIGGLYGLSAPGMRLILSGCDHIQPSRRKEVGKKCGQGVMSIQVGEVDHPYV